MFFPLLLSYCFLYICLFQARLCALNIKVSPKACLLFIYLCGWVWYMCVIYVFAVYAHVFVNLCAYLYIWRSQLNVCRPALSSSILLPGIRLAARKLKWSSCLWLPQHRGFKHGFLHGHEGFELMDLCLHIKLCCLLRHLPGPECKIVEEFVLSRWK